MGHEAGGADCGEGWEYPVGDSLRTLPRRHATFQVLAPGAAPFPGAVTPPGLDTRPQPTAVTAPAPGPVAAGADVVGAPGRCATKPVVTPPPRHDVAVTAAGAVLTLLALTAAVVVAVVASSGRITAEHLADPVCVVGAVCSLVVLVVLPLRSGVHLLRAHSRAMDRWRQGAPERPHS